MRATPPTGPQASRRYSDCVQDQVYPLGAGIKSLPRCSLNPHDVVVDPYLGIDVVRLVPIQKFLQPQQRPRHAPSPTLQDMHNVLTTPLAQLPFPVQREGKGTSVGRRQCRRQVRLRRGCVECGEGGSEGADRPGGFGRRVVLGGAEVVRVGEEDLEEGQVQAPCLRGRGEVYEMEIFSSVS